jgi:hypothetical protein
LLPSITLALKPHRIPDISDILPSEPLDIKDFPNDKLDQLQKNLFQPGAFNILDGLQRTHILTDLKKEGIAFQPKQTVLMEIWVEPDLKNLIYRIIVLNAGQKPMTIRHQVELLFLVIKDKIASEIPGIELYRERDETRRRGPRKFALDRVVSAYHAFFSKNPDVEKDNLVAQALIEENIFSLSDDALHKEFKHFLHYLNWYASLDDEVCRVYPTRDENLPTGANWFGSENVMTAFFAAAADFGKTEERENRIRDALTALLNSLKPAQPGDDVLGIGTLLQIQSGFNPRKVNVGRATRRLIFSGFKEFFREGGAKNLPSCWLAEAE